MQIYIAHTMKFLAYNIWIWGALKLLYYNFRLKKLYMYYSTLHADKVVYVL